MPMDITKTISHIDKPEPLKISTSTLVAAALWLIFFGSFIQPYEMTSGERIIYYLFVQCGGVFLIFLSLRYFKYLRYYVRLNRGYRLLYPMMIICFWGTIYGRILGPTNFSAWICDSLLVYAGAFLIILPVQKDIRQHLLVLFRLQLFCAIIFGLYALSSSPSFQDIMQNKELWMSSSEKPALTILFNIVPFFMGVVLFKDRDKKTLLAVLLGYMLCIAFGLRGTSRATSFTNLFVIPLSLLLVSQKYRGIRNVFSLFKFAVFMGLIVGGVFFFRLDNLAKEYLGAAFEQTSIRFTGYSDWVGLIEIQRGLTDRLSTEITDIRGAEAKDFIDTLSWYDYLLGKGFGVPWYSKYWGQEWDIVHTGPVHLIYRGGVPLLITYFLLIIHALKTSWRNCRNDSVAMGCFVYLIVWVARFFSYGAHLSSYYVYFFWLVIGLAFATDMKAREGVSLAKRERSKVGLYP